MKTYRFNGMYYGGGKSSGFRSLGRMVYDIIKDWADKNRPASFGELTAAFPQTLRGTSVHSKDALFATKQAAKGRNRPRNVRDEKRNFLIIRTGDGLEYAVTDQWGDMDGAGDIRHFVAHARNKAGYDIEDIGINNAPDNHFITEGQTAQKQGGYGHKKSPAKGRYWNMTVGNVQNGFVRHILGNLGNETFSSHDWEKTKEYFGGRCAYCGKDAKLQRDHVVPINKKAMGEHRLGNLVPSCKSCNEEKHQKDYREFLADNPAARRRIEEYMRRHNYVPIKDRENWQQVGEVLEEAYRAIEPIAKKYIDKLNDMVG